MFTFKSHKKALVVYSTHGSGVYDYIVHEWPLVISINLAATCISDISLVHTISNNGRIEFIPASWFVQACKNPYVLYIHDFDKANKMVKKFVANIINTRTLHGHVLHPDTQIVIQINK
jgi:hypothetical protein